MIDQENAFRLAKLLVTILVIQLFFIMYVFWLSYEGRTTLVEQSRAACERGKLDRLSNAEGWRIAEEARRAEGEEVVAARYEALAEDLEARGRINCNEAFPKAGLIP